MNKCYREINLETLSPIENTVANDVVLIELVINNAYNLIATLDYKNYVNDPNMICKISENDVARLNSNLSNTKFKIINCTFIRHSQLFVPDSNTDKLNALLEIKVLDQNILFKDITNGFHYNVKLLNAYRSVLDNDEVYLGVNLRKIDILENIEKKIKVMYSNNFISAVEYAGIIPSGLALTELTPAASVGIHAWAPSTTATDTNATTSSVTTIYADASDLKNISTSLNISSDVQRKIEGMNFDLKPVSSIELGENFKASEHFPIIDKKLYKSKTKEVDEIIGNSKYVILISDDKKEKKNSVEAHLALDIDNSDKTAEGYGNLEINLTGLGSSQDEAIADLDKMFLDVVGKLLFLISKFGK